MTKHKIVPALTSLSEEIERLSTKMSEYQNSDAIKASDLMLDEELFEQLINLKKRTDAQVKTADRKFTLAIVGEFKAGKSTFINALLKLKDGQRLSTEDSPDTACSILILNKEAGDSEACIVMKDGSRYDLSWEEAKNYTSQVYRDKEPNKFKYDDIEEIEYYVDNQLLDAIAINDLPGTGSRYYDTHTEAAKAKIQEADAVLWVTPGNKEPDASIRRLFMQLGLHHRRLIPVVNVFEDLTKSPPLYRDEDEVNSILQELRDEWSDFFDQEPVCVSAKMLEIESVKPEPDKDAMLRYGHDEILRTIDSVRQRAEKLGDSIRVKRLKGMGLDLIGEANQVAAQIDLKVTTNKTRLDSSEQEYASRQDEMDDIRSSLRPMIRSRAKSKSREICDIVAAQGRNFVEQTLQMSNFGDLKQAMKNRKKLNEDLRDRFINDYLKLNEQPNWMDQLMIDYAEDVRTIIMPEWRSFMRRVSDDQFKPGEMKGVVINWNNLTDSMLQALNTVLLRVMGIAALAALLGAIPGGAVIDAIGIVVAALVALFKDPLAKNRRLALQRVNYQVKAQEFEISNRLLEAGLAGNDYIASQINKKLTEESNKTKSAINEVAKLVNALFDARDRLESIYEELSSRGENE